MRKNFGAFTGIRWAMLALALASGVSACGSDDPAGSDDPDFTITVIDAPDATTLGTTSAFSVRVRSQNFSGTVGLDVSGAPAGWVVSLDDESVEIADDESVTVDGTITVPTNAVAAPSGAELTITGTAEPGERSAEMELVVEDEIALTIPEGTDVDGDHWPTIPSMVTMRVGSVLRIMNGDTVPHRIHALGTITGLPHQPASMGPGESYVAEPEETGSDHIYCHDHSIDPGFTLHIE